MTRSRSVFGIGYFLMIVVAGVMLVGCATGTAPDRSLAEPISTTGPATAAVGTVTDEDTCIAFGDVSTILQNATSGLEAGRMSQPEYDGWLRLATRVLDRVPATGEGPISDAITALKNAAPPVPSGMVRPTTIGTTDWYATAPLGELCADAGYLVAGEGFVGG